MFAKIVKHGIQQNDKMKVGKLVLQLLLLLVAIPNSLAARHQVEYAGRRIVITQDKDLKQQTITLDDGCVLELRGGTLKNGFIVCRDLTILGNGNTVMDFPFIKCDGNLTIRDVKFGGFMNAGVFIEYSGAMSKKPAIQISNVIFDGSGKVERFLRSYLNSNIVEASILMDGCTFTNITEYVVQFASNCTGSITNCRVNNIGNTDKSHVTCFWLGYQADFAARRFVIHNNTIDNIKASYNKVDDGREAHGIIVYGNNNKIVSNHIKNIYSENGEKGDPGMDTEGIYLKGSYNEIAYNTIIDATGSGSDGAITVKHIADDIISKRNLVHDNIISNSYSNGIVLYTDKSRIYNNQIDLGHKSECGIETFCGKSITIAGNVIVGKNGLGNEGFSGSIVVSKCKDVIIRANNISNVPTLVNSINNRGFLKVVENVMQLTDNRNFGNNTKYTAGIYIQGGEGSIIIKGNTISGKGIRGSQLIEFTKDSKVNNVRLISNEVELEDSPKQQTFLMYVIRETPTSNVTVHENSLNIKGNYISSNKGKSFRKNSMSKSKLVETPL